MRQAREYEDSFDVATRNYRKRAYSKEDYDRFYEAIDANISSDDFETWQGLQYLMEINRFRNGYTPSRKQVDKAWEHIKGKTAEKVIGAPVRRKRVLEPRKPIKPVVRSFVWVNNRGQLVKMANRNLVFMGKSYRKGQFVPKSLPKDFM